MIFQLFLSLFSVRCYAAADDKKCDPATVNTNMGGAAVLEGLVGTTKFKNIVSTVEYPFNDSISGAKKAVDIYTRTTPVGDADWANLPIGSTCTVLSVTTGAVTAAEKYVKSATGAAGWNRIIVANDAVAPLTTSVKACTDADTVLTAAEVLGTITTMTPGAARNITLPTAALLVAAIPGCKVGSTVELTVVNNAAATHVATVVKGEGITDGSHADLLAVAAKSCKTFKIRVTAIGTPAALIYQA
jgi:hypothetical protein